MCGLLAFSSPSPLNPTTISLLFALNQPRGSDSAGFFLETPDKKFLIDKALGPFSESLEKNFNPPPAKLFFGHTRAASVGSVTIENAHPFTFGSVVGAHNGTLTNFKILIDNYATLYPNAFNHNELNIDSKLIFAALNEFNDFRILSDLQGAAAIIWRDFRNHTPFLNIWRNTERPLHYGHMPNSADLYISSESNPLAQIGCSNIHEFNPFTIYQIHDGEILNTFKTM